MGPTSAFTRIGSSLQSDYLSFRAPLATAVQFHERPLKSKRERHNKTSGLQALQLSTNPRTPTNSTMDRLARLVSYLLLALLPLTAALKFDLHPVAERDSARYERCIRNFVAKEQLVVVTAILDGYRGDGQRVDMHVCFFLNPGTIHGLNCNLTSHTHEHFSNGTFC